MIKNYIQSILMICTSAFTFAQSYTFTTAGATGQYGPTQTDVNTAYSATNLNGDVLVSIQGMQQWTVPTTGTYTISAAGASGGTASTFIGGLGATMIGDFNLNAGDNVVVVVGQRGTDGYIDAVNSEGASGGGGSYVVINGTLVVAAGGGGGAGTGENFMNGYNGNPGLSTQDGGAANGVNAQMNGLPGTAGNGGTGGNWYSAGGGAGYLTNGGNSTQGNIGYGGLSFANGCTGGIGSPFYQPVAAHGGFGGGGGAVFGGGGGGGYSGGAAGTHGGNYDATGGGGGGSYNTGANAVNTDGNNSGHGLVVISTVCNISLSLTPSDEMMGNDGGVALVVTGGTAPYTYDWDNDGTGDNDDAQNLSGVAGGTYQVTVIDALGCSSTSSITVNSQLGINEQSAVTKVYPNPTSGKFVIEKSGTFTYEVINIVGAKINSGSATDTKVIDLTNMPDGVYFIKIVDAKQVSQSVKVIKH